MNLVRRAADRARRRHTTTLARLALDAALYGDYEPARRLIDQATPHGPARLATIAGVWVDAYLAATPHAEVVLVTPQDKWIAELITARLNRNGDMFVKLLTDLPAPLVRYHLEPLVRMAADARLTANPPEAVWP